MTRDGVALRFQLCPCPKSNECEPRRKRARRRTRSVVHRAKVPVLKHPAPRLRRETASTTGRAAARERRADVKRSYLVDPASSHMLVSKIKPCMSKYKQVCTVKLRMAH
jgi:hypothetical protein